MLSHRDFYTRLYLFNSHANWNLRSSFNCISHKRGHGWHHFGLPDTMRAGNSVDIGIHALLVVDHCPWAHNQFRKISGMFPELIHSAYPCCLKNQMKETSYLCKFKRASFFLSLFFYVFFFLLIGSCLIGQLFILLKLNAKVQTWSSTWQGRTMDWPKGHLFI